MSGAIRILLVDDDPLVRSGLRLMLRAAGDLEVVAEVGDGAEVTDAVTRLRPDVVLMDIRMPVVDGIAATRALRRATDSGTGPAVLVLTTFGSDRAVVDALRAGAAGYLLKDTPPAEIVAAVRKVAAGEPVLSPAVTRSLIALATADATADGAGEAQARDTFATLTTRERDVAQAVAEGLSNSEIAQRLHLSTSSVKAHLSSALTRLGLENRVQLAILAHTARQEAGRQPGRPPV